MDKIEEEKCQENPDRLRHPLKRVGNDFVEISWDQAMREIGEKTNELLKKYGPHPLPVIGGTGANAFGPVLFEANAMMKLGIICPVYAGQMPGMVRSLAYYNG